MKFIKIMRVSHMTETLQRVDMHYIETDSAIYSKSFSFTFDCWGECIRSKSHTDTSITIWERR